MLLGWFTLPVRVVLIVLAIIFAFVRRDRTPTILPLFKRGSERGWVPYVIPLAAAAVAAMLLLWHSGVTDPLRSPWSIVPAPFFVLYALVAVFGVQYSVFSIPIALALTSLVAILVYPIGFGFDHFIHVAAERIIATTGTLLPPPFFYSAHYGLTVLLADLLPGVGVDLADRLLAPLLTVALLVPLAYRSLRSVLPDHTARWGLTSLLIVPFLPLAVSTPQATANVFAVIAVFAILANHTKVAALAAIAAAFAQPMTGIIAIAIVAMMCVWRRGWRAIGVIMAAVGVAGIPLAFAIAGRIIPNLDLRVSSHPLPALQRLVAALHDAITFTAVDFSTADALAVARVLLPMLWIVLSLVGARSTYVKHTVDSTENTTSVLRSAFCVLRFAPLIALLAAAAVAATVTVPTQLAEEQTQFPLRLVQLAALLATPLAAIGLGTIFDRLRGRLPQLAGAAAIGAAATFTLLLAYPRDDAQARSGLWSVSASDIAAVHAIANDAGDAPYVVLANQMLGAAAVRELGFRPAHLLPNGNEVLAFPLPAGGPIAQKYWEYVSQDLSRCFSPSLREGEREGEGACLSRASIDTAMDLIGAQRAYIVLHDYWRNYEPLATATAAIADGELPPLTHLRIFRFTKVSPLRNPKGDEGSLLNNHEPRSGRDMAWVRFLAAARNDEWGLDGDH